MFHMRTSKPSKNKYFIRTANGGYNGAILGNPTDANANVLSNCVGYANGRFNEIGAYGKCKYQLTCNAEDFIERAKALGLTISKVPVLGGIMVWSKGKLKNGNDGAGHVAIVEKIIDSNTIYTSESSYGGAAFYNATRSNSNGRWGLGSTYKFRGCIVNPAVKDDPTPKKSIDEVAREVVDGEWGNNPKRKQKLIEAGYDYSAVQKRVNELMADDTIRVGDTVKVTNPVTYQGKRFYLYYPTYKVMELVGNRAVIGVNGVVTAAINVKNLKKVR